MPTLKHILVIRFSAMGDVAMTIPVLRAFTNQYPEVKLTILTKQYFIPLFKSLENIEVLSVDLKKEHKGLYGLYKLSRKLKRLKINAVADLHNVLRTKILKFFFLEIRFVQINKGRTEKKALVKGENFSQLITTHERYGDVFKKLGYPIDLSNPQFPKPATLSSNLKAFLDNHSRKTIGIAPFATYESKMYPLELMEQVIDELSKTYNILLFGGGEQEVNILNRLEEKFLSVTNIAGKLSLEEELDLISNLDVMISMDSGNAHIASMLGVKVLTIYGVTHPFAGFYPFNQDIENVLLADRKQYPKIPTSIYGNKHPENYTKAAGSIPPKKVIEKIKSII